MAIALISPEAWTVIMMSIATIIVAWKRTNVVFKGVIIWALIAIAVRNGNNYWIVNFAGIYIVLLLGLILLKRWWRHHPLQNPD